MVGRQCWKDAFSYDENTTKPWLLQLLRILEFLGSSQNKMVNPTIITMLDCQDPEKQQRIFD